MIIILYVFSVIFGITHLVSSDSDEVIFRRDHAFTAMVQADEYKSETHYVTTKDGYILTMHRLLAGNCSGNEDFEPMFLMHSLLLSSDDWILPGPNRAHGYIYASAGRDVWLPNSRGNYYSRNHTTLDPNIDLDYWNFSFVEMAKYDMPACIDYILETTGKEQIVFVGHGQGVSLLLLLCAEQPEYNAKFKVGFGLSTTAWLNHSQFIAIQLDGRLSTVLTTFIETGANMEILPRGGFYQLLLKSVCGTYDSSYTTCSALYFSLLGDNPYQIPNDTLIEMTGHVPSGTSLKNFVHWIQIQQNGFRRYDHGSLKNLLIYRSLLPPLFDLSNVTMNWIFITSKQEYHIPYTTDIDILVRNLMNATTTKCIISDTTFGYLDYTFGKDVPTLITPSILNYLDTDEFECPSE